MEVLRVQVSMSFNSSAEAFFSMHECFARQSALRDAPTSLFKEANFFRRIEQLRAYSSRFFRTQSRAKERFFSVFSLNK